MTPPLRPPRFSRRLLVWAARRLNTPDLADDAAELFGEKGTRAGWPDARRWYRKQSLGAVRRALVVRTSPPRPPRRRWSPTALHLDSKLALRMLVRYPGLTLVGGVAIAFAIFIGAGLFAFINLILPARDLPLPHGDQVVGLRYWDLEASTPAPLDADSLRVWADELRTVNHIGGYRTVMRNMASDNDNYGLVEVAEMSPSGFDAAGVRPLMGRVLRTTDAVAGAPPVIVISHRIWHTDFGASTDVLGRSVTLGTAPATIVGIMPEGFGFPLHHDVWTPLMAPAGPLPGVRAFGRLAPGISLEQARAEADALTSRIERPQSTADRRLTTEVLSYRESLFDQPVTLLKRAIVLQLNLFAALFLVLVAANVALLMFARAAAREREFVVRTALGASRGRIARQLFVEALALSLVASACGLAATGPGLNWIATQMTAMGGGTPPFWFQPRVTTATTVYAMCLAILAAIIAGVVPALKTTGRHVTARLGQASAGGGGVRFGGIWTGVIIAQIAATVVFSSGAALMVRQAWRTAYVDAPFPAAEYVSMRVEMDREAGDATRFTDLLDRFQERLALDPGVRRVTIADRLPLVPHPDVSVELESAPDAPIQVSESTVALNFFEAFDGSITAGRAFTTGDLNAGVAVVDRYFVTQVLGGRSAVGTRLRTVDPTGTTAPGPWVEIIGVVNNIEAYRPDTTALDLPQRAMVYRPLRVDAGNGRPVMVAARTRSGGEGLPARLQQAAADISPTLQLHDVKTLDQVADGDVAFWKLWAQLIVMVSSVALFLSLAGIYAATAFSVSRRTREIGIRVALGASAPRIAASILRRPLTQVALGVLLGNVLVAAMHILTGNRITPGYLAGLMVLGVATLLVCALACAVPMRRALRVQPTDALGAEL